LSMFALIILIESIDNKIPLTAFVKTEGLPHSWDVIASHEAATGSHRTTEPEDGFVAARGAAPRKDMMTCLPTPSQPS
jgi:hypothetical protein